MAIGSGAAPRSIAVIARLAYATTWSSGAADNPSYGRVAAAGLAGVATKPTVESRLAGVEHAAIMSRRVQWLRTAEVS